MPDEYLAGVDADPKLHLALARKPLVLLREHRLDLDCAMQGINDAAEFSKHAVARRIRDPALMLRNRFIEDAAAGGQPGDSTALVGPHHARIIRDVSRQDGGQFAGGGRLIHRLNPPLAHAKGDCRPAEPTRGWIAKLSDALW